MELIFEKSQAGRRAGRVPSYGLPVPEVPTGLRRAQAPQAAGAGRERDRAPLHESRRPQLRDRHGLLPARLLHDEAQPPGERASRGAAGIREPASAPGGRGRAGGARADVGAAADPRRGGGAAGGDAAAGGRLAGRADGPDADACVLRGSWRRRAARHDHHGRHGARHQPCQRDDGRLQAREGRDDRPGQPRPRRPPRQGERAHRRADADQSLDARPLRRGHRRGGGDLSLAGSPPLLRRRQPERRRRHLQAG